MAAGGRSNKFLAWETCCCIWVERPSLWIQLLDIHAGTQTPLLSFLLETSHMLERHQSSFISLRTDPHKYVRGWPIAGFGASVDHQTGSCPKEWSCNLSAWPSLDWNRGRTLNTSSPYYTLQSFSFDSYKLEVVGDLLIFNNCTVIFLIYLWIKEL